MFGSVRGGVIERRRLPGIVFWGAFCLFNLFVLTVTVLWVRSLFVYEEMTGMAALAQADAAIAMAGFLLILWSCVNALFALVGYRIYVRKGQAVPQ